MTMKKTNTKKLTTLALCTAMAMILSYLESLIPLSFAIPGIKMGLANIAIIFILYRFGAKEACIVSLMRILWMALLFGNAMTLIYSICGAVLSMGGMLLLKKCNHFSQVGVSVIGGILHNAGQIFAAMVLMDTAEIIYYLPALIISGTVSGVLIGIVASILIKRVPIK